MDILMDEEMEEKIEEEQALQLLLKLSQENQTRKILAILNECSSLDEAEKKVRALLPD